MEATDNFQGSEGIPAHKDQVETDFDMLISTELEKLDAENKEVVEKQQE